MQNSIQTSFTDWESGLQHFGTKGMKWGQRRYQNPDGSLTPLGEKRYGSNGNRSSFGRALDLNKMDNERVVARSKADYYRGRANDRYSRQKYKAEKKGLAVPQKDEKTRKLLAKLINIANCPVRAKKWERRSLRIPLVKT